MKIKINDWSNCFKNGKPKTKTVEFQDLEPCPFCGGTATPVRTGMEWCISCDNCHSKCGYELFPNVWDSKECLDTFMIRKCARKWNKRFVQQPQPMHVRMRKVIENMKYDTEEDKVDSLIKAGIVKLEEREKTIKRMKK